jgi:hypothetical protein
MVLPARTRTPARSSRIPEAVPVDSGLGQPPAAWRRRAHHTSPRPQAGPGGDCACTQFLGLRRWRRAPCGRRSVSSSRPCIPSQPGEPGPCEAGGSAGLSARAPCSPGSNAAGGRAVYNSAVTIQASQTKLAEPYEYSNSPGQASSRSGPGGEERPRRPLRSLPAQRTSGATKMTKDALPSTLDVSPVLVLPGSTVTACRARPAGGEDECGGFL